MSSVFDMKSARLDALALQLHTNSLSELDKALRQRIDQYKELNMPLVLDVQDFSNPAELNIGGITSVIRSYGLALAGLRHSDGSWEATAKKHGLPFSQPDNLSSEVPAGNKPASAAAPVATPEPAPAEPAEAVTSQPSTAAPQATVISQPTIFISSPVRSGQQVYAENGDLIVTGVVSKGAELIADGNIHIYGPMRGRALAGANGNLNARIFIHSMQAELVSVAGIYRTFEQELPTHLNHKAVQVFLQDNRLVISAIEAE